MWNEDDRKWLYEQMRKKGVDTGSYDDFVKSLDNAEDRDWYYQKSVSFGFDVGSADDFADMMVEPSQGVTEDGGASRGAYNYGVAGVAGRPYSGDGPVAIRAALGAGSVAALVGGNNVTQGQPAAVAPQASRQGQGNVFTEMGAALRRARRGGQTAGGRTQRAQEAPRPPAAARTGAGETDYFSAVEKARSQSAIMSAFRRYAKYAEDNRGDKTYTLNDIRESFDRVLKEPSRLSDKALKAVWPEMYEAEMLRRRGARMVQPTAAVAPQASRQGQGNVFTEMGAALRRARKRQADAAAVGTILGYARVQARQELEEFNDRMNILSSGGATERAMKQLGLSPKKSDYARATEGLEATAATARRKLDERARAGYDEAVKHFTDEGYTVEPETGQALMPSYGDKSLTFDKSRMQEVQVLKLTDKDGHTEWIDGAGERHDTATAALAAQRGIQEAAWEAAHEEQQADREREKALERAQKAKAARTEELRANAPWFEKASSAAGRYFVDYLPSNLIVWGLTGERQSELHLLWGDKQWNQLDAAERAAERAMLQKKKVTEDWGFWHTAFDALLSRDIWDMGAGGVKDAVTLLQTANDVKDKKLEDMSDSERLMLEAVNDENDVNSRYESSFMQQLGYGAAFAVPLCLEFALTGGLSAIGVGGGKAGAALASRAATKWGVAAAMKNMPRLLSKEGSSLAAKRAALWTMRHTGMAVDDLSRAVVYANTTGAARTADDAIRRHLGEMSVTDDGRVVFSDGKDWGDAVLHAEVSQVGEYFSELLGASVIDPALGVAGRAARRASRAASRAANTGKGGALGAVMRGYGRMSHSAAGDYIKGIYDKLASSAVGKKSTALLRSAKVDSLVGETLEEYENTLWKGLFGDAQEREEAWKDLTDPRAYLDTALATGATMGFLWFHTTAPVAGASILRRYKMSRRLDTADNVARTSIDAVHGADAWRRLRERLDNAVNDDLLDVAMSIIDDEGLRLNDEQKADVIRYTCTLAEVRGFNFAASKGGSGEGEEQAWESSRVAMGYLGMTVAEAEDALGEVEAEMSRHGSFTPEVMASLERNPLEQLSWMRDSEDWDDAGRSLASLWYSARLALEGARGREADEGEAIEVIASRNVSRITHVDGAVHPIVLTDGRKAWLLSGEGGEKSIVYIDESGAVSFGTWDEVAGEEGVMSTGDALAQEASSLVQLNEQTEADEAAAIEAAEQEQVDKSLISEDNIPDYALNDEVSLKTDDGTVRGLISNEANEDGLIEVYTEKPIGGKKINLFTREQLNSMLVDRQPAAQPVTQQAGAGGGGEITENGDFEGEPGAGGDVSPRTVAEGLVDGAPEDYVEGMELTVLDDEGVEKPAMVMGRGYVDGGSYVPGEGGPIVEYMMDGEVCHGHVSWLDDRVTGYRAVGQEPGSGDVSQAEPATTETTEAVAENAMQPIGHGFFGDIFDQFKGKVKEALNFLLRHKGGDLLGVWHRDDVGDIDLVWGDRAANAGLDHIIYKHVGEGKDFADEREMMAVIDDVVKNGVINDAKSKWDKITLEREGKIVVISRNVRDGQGNIVENKNWVVTSFDNNIPKSQKQRPAVTPVTPNDNQGGRAVASGDASVGKVTDNFANVQVDEGEKVAGASTGIESLPFGHITINGRQVSLYRQHEEKDGVSVTRVVGMRGGKEVSVPTAYFPVPDGYAIDEDYIVDGEALGVKELRESGDGAAATIIVRDDTGITSYDVKLSKNDPMPMREVGTGKNAETEPDWLAVTPERGHDWLFGESGLDRADANEIVKNNLEAAQNAVKKAGKLKPKKTTNPFTLQAERERIAGEQEAAQRTLDYWNAVQARQTALRNAELERSRAEQAERDRIAHEQAVADEAVRLAEVLAQRAEQAERGAHAVHPAIRERWDAAEKIEGFENEITLPNGERVSGRYVLVESGAATPSHNPNGEFVRNEGFPVDENGNTVNDRDYGRDKSAQEITREMARTYDSRAIQSVPVVSRDGVVLSGNGRTMAGELAAQAGTDGAYLDHLRKYGQQFGFTPEQVGSMQHPRVVFVPDVDMPYTTETFAKFNAQDMKGQNRTESAVKMGKTVDDATFGRVISSINGFDTLSEFYNDPKAATEAINELRGAGVINAMQYGEMFDGDKVSGTGRQMLENMLVGKAFESNPDAIRQLSEFPALRQRVVAALAEVSNNLKLGANYSLESELAEAINLAYQALKSGYKQGEPVSLFARQLNLFPLDMGRESVADYTNATILMLADVLNHSEVNKLKKVLAMYNHRAAESAAGQMDLFSGEVTTKEQIIKEVLAILNYGTKQEQQAAVAEAVERRKAEAQPTGSAGVQQDGVAVGSGSGNTGAERSGGSETPVERESDLAQTEVTAPLSEEVDEFDKPFVISSRGTTTFGEVGAESGLTAAPIKLSLGENIKDENGANHGYGWLHIEAGHGDQIRAAGFSSVEEFVETVARNYDTIREGSIIADNQTYLLEISDEHNNTLFIQLSRDGSYWNVNSAGIFKKKYSRRKLEVFTRPALEPDTNTDTSGVDSGRSEGVTTPAGNSPRTSEDKGSENSETGKEKAEKVAESKASTVIAEAEQEVNTEPTEAQKEAGNYKKGHIKLDGFDITIEQPKGSVRRGRDASGKQWEQKMQNTYGYIRGTEGVDGDHIDVFLSDDPSQGDVFVVDQVNKDGSFDEHKVMYGFPYIESARKAYLSNYGDDWQGLGAITPVSKEEFKKWIDSSHRKTKPFAEYSSVKPLGDTQLGEQPTAGYSIEPTTYTNKKGKTTPMHFVTFGRELSKDEIRAGKELAKESRGWWDSKQGGFMMRDEDSAKALAEALSNEEAVQDAQPLSLGDVQAVTDQADMKAVDETIKVEQEPQTSPQYDYDREDDVYDKTLTGLRNVLNDRKRGAIPNIKSIENIIRDLRKRAKTIEDGMATAAGETIPQAFDALANLNGKRRAYEQFLSDIRKKMAETERDDALAAHGVKLGDKIMYKGKEVTIHDADARQVTLDVGLAPVMYEVTDWENVELPKPVKEYHGGDRVFSVKHNANKDIFVAHHKDGTVEYTFTDGTKANADEVQDALPEPKKVDVESLMGELNEKGEAKLSDHIKEPQQEESTEQPKQEEKKAKSKWVDDADAERFEELRRRLRQKLGGQLNMGVDPEAFALGVEMSYLMLKHGARKFAEFAKQMIEALGENVRPYLKSFYNGARDLPEMAEYEKELTPYDEVRTFDVMNFDKEGAKDIVATAEHIVREQAAEREAKEATDKLKQERNEQRKETEQEVAANTEALASEAATVASEVESKLPSARSEREVNDLAKNIDDAIDKVNDQLALLGYYEAEPVESDFNEAYGYMRNAEKKAVKNVTELFKTLTKELGISDPVVYDTKGKKQKSVTANIAPAGGDVTMRFMLNRDKGVELYIDFMLEPDYENNRDNLVLKGIMFRPEKNLPNGGRDYLRANNFFPVDVTVPQMLHGIRSVCQEWLPAEDYVAMAQRVAAENAGNQKENTSKGGKSKKKSVSLQQQTIPDLFSGLFGEEDSNLKPTSNEQEVHVQPRTGTSEREGGHQREQNEPLGESKQNEDERPDTGRVAGRSGNDTKSDTAGGSRVSEPSDGKRNVKPAKPEPAPLAESERKNTHNNHAERGTDYAPKGTSARIEANIKAIETMQRLIESGEPATPEDMSVLRKFSGWGGLAAAFKEKVSSGDSGYNPHLRDDYQPANPINARLRELLSPEAYEAANMSRNTAYYTPAPIIDVMWDVARAMGFRGGNVLEGSAGIGKVLGQMPSDMSERSNIQAIEVDETTGNILKLLYPDAKVDVKGFEKTYIPNGSVDLAITNVPFGDILVKDETGDKDLSKKFRAIHDFCIAKNVRKLKEGGIGIFISTSGTLDSANSAKLRNWIVNEGNADVVGAFRMHKDTFGGAGVTSDIIVIRKRVNGRKSANAIDVSGTLPIRTVKYNTGETKRGSSEVVIKDLALDVNKHFVEHPEDMAGEMAFAFEKGGTYRATSKALYPSPSINQEQRLSEWAQQFKDMDWDKAEERESQQVVYEDLGEDVKEGSMLLDSDGNLCLAQRGKAVPINVNANKVKGHTKAECFNAYKAIKDALADVLEYQTTHSDDSGLQQRLAKLNKAYDSFVKTYGHLNKNTSISFLRSDMDYPSIAALESVSETGDKSGKRIVTYGKTDIFSRRVVETESEPKPTTIKDGIIASIYLNGRVDVPYIAEQLNMSDSDVRQQIIESGLGFENPTTTEMEVSYEYLSGNVREKLRQAQENNTDGRYDANIKALERVIPMNIPAHLIEFTLGSSWVEPKLYEDFVKERTGLDVKLTNAGGTWIMSEPYYTNTEQNKAMGVISEKCDKTILGHELIKAAITFKSISVTKTVSTGYGSSKTTETIVDKEATMACANKIDEIRQDFKDWARGKMQGDPEMSERMERVYNELFNNSVPKEIPDEFVPEHFGGAATVVNGKPFKLRPHQAKAVIRATTQPLMLAHEVGTGKTYTLISIAMEMRRLGTARKPMIVVQNATVGQFVASAKALYPNAKILTLEDADRNAEGRRNFYAKIRYNDWDMIVVPQSVFERIPDSEERQIRFVEDKVEEKMMVLEKMREAANDDRDPVLRQAQRELDQLNDELNDLKLALQERKSGGNTEKDEKREAKTRQNAMVKAQEMLDRETDDVANFDDMGIDALLIDEAHEYKHLGFATAMQRGVKGVDPSYSKKSQGVYLKTQAVLESKNGKNVVFATGTPISNTAAEIWTFMRYLMPADTMREYGIYYFDDFVRNFGNIQQMLEFATNGKYKENNRFAGYVNLPELVRIWAGVADTVLTREAGGVSDKIPKMEGEKAQDIYLPQTKALRGVMKFVKDQLDDYEKMSGKEKKENSHIPLVMYGIAKAAAVDARLVLEDAADEPNSKTNEAVRQTLRSLEDTKEYNGTVAIFADNYQNKATGFNLYEDIRKKLIDAGVPETQVVVMKSGMSIKKKLEIFDKVNRGEVRVIMGSTFTLGTGVNIQERLHTLIHVDAPNRPMDYTQRNGRILRQGNLHNEWGIPVRVLRFGVEDSLDVTAYQRLKTKGAIADSIMEGKKMMSNSMENRVLEEEQDLFGDITAQLSGSQYALLKNQVEKEVKKLEARKKQWEADQTYVHNQKPRLKALIKDSEERAKRNKEALAKVEAAKNDGITIGKMKFPSLDAMGDYIKDYNSKQREQQEQVRTASGYKAEAKSDLTVSVGGFDFHVHRVISKEQKQEKGQLSLSFFSKTQMTYSCPELGLEDVPVDGQRLKSALEDILENVLSGDDFREKAEYADRAAERYKGELQQVEARDGKPFEYADELKQAKEKLAEYEELMKAEMAEKEAKYAEMDASVEAAKGVQLSDEDSDDVTEDTAKYRIREDEPPTKTGIGYKVFVLKDGKLYPPMVANPNGEATPVGVWLDADAAPVAGVTKTGRQQVKAGGKGTQGGSGKLAYRPGWHLGEIPYAVQFNRMNPETGQRELFPANFVWAEVEYANDVDYQEEAMSYGMNASGKFQHSLAGLPRLPENGSYRYRTNPDPNTDPWVITGAMKVNRILKPSEVDAMVEAAGREPQQRQAGAITDEQVEALNAKVKRTMQEDRDMMRSAVQQMGEKLHTDINIIEDVNEITHPNAAVQERRRKSKGWYDPSTGEEVIIVPNNNSVADVEATVLHEIVGHKGLRELFGKDFDTFLSNVFDNVDDETRRKIVERAMRNGWDFRKATEEYLASLAESTDFENEVNRSAWQKIKDFFMELLRKAGVRLSKPLTDADLRYILWRSYQHRVEQGALGVAADVVMREKLGVNGDVNTESDEMMFRDDDFSVRDRAVARDEYERMVSSGSYQFQEAVQDSMLGLKRLYQSILGKETRIEDIAGNENAYLAENRMSSVNAAEQHEYYIRYMKPLLEAISKIAGKSEAERARLSDYMMAKHGLERNLVLAERDAREAEAAGGDYNDAYASCRERDYAGLTALTGEADVAAAEAAAQQFVDDYERAHDTTDLWQRVNDATSATLEKIYRSGLLSRERYQQIQQMFENYIPLQGWDETTSDEVYGYLTSKYGPLTGSPIKRAQGRSSKADDPIATIALMADTAIRQGNRNKMKQTFLNFVLNHPSDLVSVNSLWLQYNAAMDEWEPVFADIDENDSPADVERKVEAFEERMEQLAENDPDNYKHGRDTANIPYKVVRGNLREHQVLVKRGGRTYVLTINGNPRAAQALNGLTNPDVETGGVIAKLSSGAQWVNRNLSAFYTTRNPDFVVSNFFRDMLYSNCMTWVKESPQYALRFHYNFGRVNPVVMRRLFGKWEKGTLDESNYIERMFKLFMLHGGETGYTNVKDIEGHKRTISRELKRRGSLGRRAWGVLGEQLDLLNRSAENCARFAAFVTSRELGRSVERSAYDAKEVSVNFNKKGSGGKMLGTKGQDRNILKLLFNPKSYLRAEDRAEMLGQLGSYIGGGGRMLYVFWNAGVQGMTNFARAGKRHPVKALVGAASMLTLGYVIPLLAQAMAGGDDDDDKNAYYNLPEYVRRSNIIINAGDQWIAIPLPIEFRALYGLGELAYGVTSGNERYSDSELAYHLGSQVSQILPLDMLEGGGGINPWIPSLAKPFTEAYLLNKGWSGLPVSKPNTPWNKYDPEWTKAYKSTNHYLVSGAQWLNEATGGDDYRKGWLDINPAKVEYLLSGTFGGAFTTFDKLAKMGEMAFGDRDFEWRNMLIANRVVKTGDERTEGRKLQNEYFKYKERYEATKRLVKKYGEEQDGGSQAYAKKLEQLTNSEEYAQYVVFQNYEPLFNALYEVKGEASDTELVAIEAEEKELRREMVNLMHAVEDGGIVDSRSSSDARLKEFFEGDYAPEVRDKAADEIARRLGGTDSYGNSDASYNLIYADKRDYVDHAEDVLLQVAKKRALEAGDDERYKALDKAQRELTEIRKGKHTKEVDIAGFGEGNDEDVLKRLRERRREIMKELEVAR